MENEKILVDKKVIENVCKYCEYMRIYDKLGKFDNFYYKLKIKLNEIKELENKESNPDDTKPKNQETKKFLYAKEPFIWRKTKDKWWDEYEYPAGTKVEIIGSGPRGYDVMIVENGVEIYETGMMEWSETPIN